jgi:hypothetical protein
VKIKIVSLLMVFISFIYANESNTTQKLNYVLNGSGLLDIRTANQINVIGAEVKQKTGVNVYLDLKGNNGIDMELPFDEKVKLMNQIKVQLVKDLPKPYAVLAIAMDQQYVGVLMSDDVKKAVDGADVRDSYVVPLLAAKDKNTMKSKMSAAAFNGYAQIADSIAEYYGIILESSVGSEGKTASTIWRVFMYTLVLAGIILYAVIVLREKKIKKELTKRDEEAAKEKEKQDGNE